MKKVVIIVAGGSGQRMNSDIPKQFLVVRDLPVLMHTISLFERYDKSMEIRLVLPKEQVDRWNHLCVEYDFRISCELYYGGETRFHSVQNGLEDIPDRVLVGVHDGVRPAVSQDTLNRCYSEAVTHGAVIPVTEVKESIRFLVEDGSRAGDRSLYRLVQTPGVFHSEILKKAYSLPYSESFTDDATVVEAAGYTIYLTEGNVENIKITSPTDLLLAGTLLDQLA